MSIKDIAFQRIKSVFYYEDYYRLKEAEKILDEWFQKGYLNAVGLVATRPRFFPVMRESVAKYGNVTEMHQSNDGIFTVIYSKGHEDYLTANGQQALAVA